MNCPKCGSMTLVKDSRLTVTGSIRRRRKCADCDHMFTTYEILAEKIDELQKLNAFVLRIKDKGLEPVRKKPNNPKSVKSYRSGYIVPLELEADWSVLKKHGYRDDEAAAVLKLTKEAK